MPTPIQNSKQIREIREKNRFRRRKKYIFRLLSVGVPRSIEENVPPKRSFSVVARQQAEGLVVYFYLFIYLFI